MRTDSTKYSADFIVKAEEFIQNLYGKTEHNKTDYVGDLEKITNLNNAMPHEAIRVTRLELTTIECDEPKMATLYRFIWRRTVESCMSDEQVNMIEAKITAPQKYIYKTSIEIPAFLGYKRLSISPEELLDTQNKRNGLVLFMKSIITGKNALTPEQINSKVSIKESNKHYSESGLIQALEDQGIGRPSTYSFIVDTIQEREYVKKMDIEGITIQCVDFSWKKGEKEIQKQTIDRVFGKEKQKLVIQPLGKQVIETLLPGFESLFSYDYTKMMEEQLDKIANHTIDDWHKVCKECDEEIKKCSKPIQEEIKQKYMIDAEHELVFGVKGAFLLKTNAEDKKTEYIPIKKEKKVELEKLKMGEYTLEDLVDDSKIVKEIGEYEGHTMFFKNGKYGKYVQWGDKKESLRGDICNQITLTIEKVVEYLQEKQKVHSEDKTKGVLRIITPNLNIRNGKFGPYLYYQPPDSENAKKKKKPEFYPIKKFKGSIATCEISEIIEWIKETYPDILQS